MLFLMVVHVQTKDDNWNFSSANLILLVPLLELRPHVQIISNWQTITRKLNKNHDKRSLTLEILSTFCLTIRETNLALVSSK